MKKKITSLILLSFIGMFLYAQNQGQDPLLDILRSELNHQFEEMQNLERPPYFMDFRVVDETRRSIHTEFGVVSSIVNTRVRNFVPSIRIGDMEFDNKIQPGQVAGGQRINLPLNDDPMAIKQVIWDECFNRFRRAIDDFERAVARREVRVEQEDRAPSFSEAPVEIYFEPPLSAEVTSFDEAYWSERLKRLSVEFLRNPDIEQGSARIRFDHQRRYYLNSEGTEVVQNLTYAEISINGMIRAEDGMVLPLFTSYFAFLPCGLPTDEEMLADVESLIERLVMLQNAPLVSSYTGPALLSGAASGVFFHEIFGHRIEGQRLKLENDAQTFKRMVGQSVLPASLNVFDDPTLRQYLGRDLAGFYTFDDQGVRGERVEVVRNGILTNFLMTRTPIDGFYRSTGHARADLGFDVESRQSNLIIETTDPRSEEELRRLLIEEAIAQGREYAFYFKTVSGGFTQTSAMSVNSFAVLPLEVYRVWVDGRPDEMVRGVDLIGTPLSMFAGITHAGEMSSAQIFTGSCGAMSGWVPVTAISPTILVRQVEMQRQPRAQDRGPILSRP